MSLADDPLEKTVVRKSKRKKLINTDSNVEFEILTADINRKQMESRQLNIRVGGELEFPPFPNGEIWSILRNQSPDFCVKGIWMQGLVRMQKQDGKK